MSDQDLRIGDAEREQAAAALAEHFVQGRLTNDEHLERLDQIWSARTRRELVPVFDDLPGPGRASTRPTPPSAAHWTSGVRRRRRGLPGPIFLVLAILVVLTIVTHLPIILFGLVAWFFVCHRTTR